MPFVRELDDVNYLMKIDLPFPASSPVVLVSPVASILRVYEK